MKTIFYTLLLIVGGIYLWDLTQPSDDIVPRSYIDNNNFDGSYNIPYSDSTCGELGYQFKLKHQQDGYSSTSKMRKSNCRVSASGGYEGYIYPSKAPNMRIFWMSSGGTLAYRD